MGRPVNKRFFGTGAGSQLKVRAKIGANAEGDGYIVSQRSSNRYRVTVGSNTGVCKLVVKSDGTLSANEMTITVLTDAGTTAQVSKLFNRTAIVNDQKVKWTFAASLSDGAVQIEDEAATNFYTISISSQPANTSVVEPAAASFSVTAAATPTTTLTYQWQKQEGGTGAWANVANATANTYTLSSTVAADDNTDKYRVLVLADNADTVTSNAAVLTVTV